MKFMKIMAALLFICGYSTASADVITMYGKEKNGYNQPQYYKSSFSYNWPDRFDIVAIADADNFPWSSSEQGSVFVKIFEDLAEKEHIPVVFHYPIEGYEEAVSNFEKGKIKLMSRVNAVFGMYYKNIDYSQNQYIYPAFFENKVHIITRAHNGVAIKSKDDLKKYKGVYAETDYFSDFVLKDFASIGIKKAKDFPKAYEELLTGNADYVVASYYTSQIELYKLGIRDYVVYSKDPVWKMPMFFRATRGLAEHPRTEYLRKYLKSPRYKKVRDEALQELLDIYKENTMGIVPPTYVNVAPAPEKNEMPLPPQKEEKPLIPDAVLPLSVHMEQGLEK